MTISYGIYEWLFDELGDPRVKNWPLMSGPIPVTFILVFYIYVIKCYLPEWMKNRPAFSLKAVINAYNIFQVIVNAIIFQGILTSGWTTTYTLGCQMVDYSDNEEAVRMASWMWWTVMLKIFELIETTFFILRKKDNQASFLHVYHHIISVTIMWFATKYTAGGMASMTPLLNTLVHVIMYAYYFVSANASPEFKAKLNKWKMWLTVVQMIQFTIMLVHILQALAPSCGAPRVMFWLYFPNLIFVYYLFFDFFKSSYGKKTKRA